MLDHQCDDRDAHNKEYGTRQRVHYKHRTCEQQPSDHGVDLVPPVTGTIEQRELGDWVRRQLGMLGPIGNGLFFLDVQRVEKTKGFVASVKYLSISRTSTKGDT